MRTDDVVHINGSNAKITHIDEDFHESNSICALSNKDDDDGYVSF